KDENNFATDDVCSEEYDPESPDEQKHLQRTLRDYAMYSQLHLEPENRRRSATVSGPVTVSIIRSETPPLPSPDPATQSKVETWLRNSTTNSPNLSYRTTNTSKEGETLSDHTIPTTFSISPTQSSSNIEEDGGVDDEDDRPLAALV